MQANDINFSKNTIEFSKEKKFMLQISNKSTVSSYIFKIKTTKLNTYEVKPPFGSIQPGDKKSVQFKIVSPLSPDESKEAVLKDKFQLQFSKVPSDKVPKSKTQFKAFWDELKNDPKRQTRSTTFTFPIQIIDEHMETIRTEPFSPLKAKNVLPKLQNTTAGVKKFYTFQSNFDKNEKDSEQLSKQFQKLKQQQQKLLSERESIYKQQPKTSEKSGKGITQIIILIIVFLMSIVIGNFLKLRVFVNEETL